MGGEGGWCEIELYPMSKEYEEILKRHKKMAFSQNSCWTACFWPYFHVLLAFFAPVEEYDIFSFWIS
jgi:hypothetical protein